MTGRAPCIPGCTCGKHRKGPRPVCPEGCACNRHDRPRKIDWDDPESRRAYGKEQARKKYAENPEQSRAAARRWSAANRLYVKYKLTNAAWQQMLERQDGRCYMCHHALDVTADRAIHVDHDHGCCPSYRSCGKCIRGLACWPCNKGVGRLRDEPDRIRRVAENLRVAQLRLRSARE